MFVALCSGRAPIRTGGLTDVNRTLKPTELRARFQIIYKHIVLAVQNIHNEFVVHAVPVFELFRVEKDIFNFSAELRFRFAQNFIKPAFSYIIPDYQNIETSFRGSRKNSRKRNKF